MTFGYECPHCKAVSKVERAIVLFCPDCKARPGEPCVDMRTVATANRVPVASLHAARTDLLLKLDESRPGAVVAPMLPVATG